MPTVTDENKVFDPEGSGFDMANSIASGDVRDETGHLGSLDMRTGMLLKGMKHPTIQLAVDAEKARGNVIIKKDDGRYYSVPDEDELLKPLIEGISYTNAKNYFGFNK